jgi:NADPH-dependent 2,4-dienoyl-CoA reductase/sulfur reductase-like enzyme
MDLNREMEQRGRLQTMVGEVYIKDTDEDGSLIVSISSKTTMKFDAIVLACGIKPDCLSNPFIQKIHSQWPIKVKDGYPCLSEDLQWTDGIYVVGGLASLSVGPDGGNLMGNISCCRDCGHCH